ncbi:MAG TPA: MFS transporter [Mobilitalea sp.]|nr:MFS transporter [Mobilitalea sp.]
MEKLARQLTLKYAFLQSTYWITQCAICSFAAVFLHYKHFDNTQIGIIFSVSSFFTIILQPLISSFADKSKRITLRQIVIIFMFIVMAAAIVLYIIPNSFLLTAIIYILINTIQFTLNPLLNSLAFEHMNKGIPMNYGLARGTGSIAFAVMSYLIGIFVNQYGAGILIAVFIISYCFFIISAFTFRLKNPLSSSVSIADHMVSGEHTTADTKEHPEAAPAGILEFFLKYKRFSLLLIGVTLLFYTHNMLNTYLINIVENAGGNSADFGLSLTIAAVLELPTMAAFFFIVKKIDCSTLIKVSAFFFLVKIIIAWLAPNIAAVYLSQAFQMLAFALFTPASVFYVNSIIEEQDRIKGQSMLGVAIFGISGTLSNITGGKILDTVGVSDMLLLGTIVSAVGLIVICFSTEKIKIKA